MMLKVNDVFVPGQIPQHTYNPRASEALEGQLEEMIDDGGSIICVSGLTKMGKTVLVERLLPEAEHVRIDGSQFSTMEDFWTKIGDKVGVYPNVTISSSSAQSFSAGVSGSAAFPGLPRVGGKAGVQFDSDAGHSFGTARPIGTAALEALQASGKGLIIDDFHFVKTPLQREIVRSLKDPVLRGLTVVVISTSHRTLDVIQAEPNMDGRARPLKVTLWNKEELAVIASTGFNALRLRDSTGQITEKLTSNAFGSPHLMQKFCRSICKQNGIREGGEEWRELEPVADWEAFFTNEVEGISERWFDRLLRGPQEKSRQRTKWTRREGGVADNYALVMEALSLADAKFEIPKDEIKKIVDQIAEGDSPGIDKISRALVKISQIASRPLQEKSPTEDDLKDAVSGDVHFVLEYVDEGPNSKVHITDPFFAYFLRWGAKPRVERAAQLNQEADSGAEILDNWNV